MSIAAADGAPVVDRGETACWHCGSVLPAVRAPDEHFCCTGCAGAYALIHDLGLQRYYGQRTIDPKARPQRPEGEAVADISAYIRSADDGTASVDLVVDGMHCAACVWLIESVLTRQPGVVRARLNMSTRRLSLVWRGDAGACKPYLEAVEALGYRLVPFDPSCLAAASDEQARILLKALAVAGFAAGNIMFISIAIWAGHVQGMGDATRTFLHWVSALIALPAVAYAGQPFFRSALAVLRQRRTNMDVPISLGVILATSMSIYYTAVSGQHAYFDSACTLLFFLLVGRYLDHRARGQARALAERILSLRASPVQVLDPDGQSRMVRADRVEPGMVVQVATGERIGVDGVILTGNSEIDTSLVTGEADPVVYGPGAELFSGMVNLGASLQMRATRTGDATLLAEMVRLMEAAESRRSRFVALADRVARRYAPTVHLAALLTFLGWVFIGQIPALDALSHAVAVLIITCPCALALAVPTVQVLASGRLMGKGILMKSPTALERLAAIDQVMFDKTGTLTLGRPLLLADAGRDEADLALAASMAVVSRHPLARALVAVAPPVRPLDGVQEHPGQGLSCGELRLGNRLFCAVDGTEPEADGPEIWLRRADGRCVRFAFADQLRVDAVDVVSQLRRAGLRLGILSGDRAAVVSKIAAELAINDWQAACPPAAKVAALEGLRDQQHKVLMVGDGLNDAPALAAAHVSMSPAGAADIAQTAADLVFQGDKLAGVIEAIGVAKRAETLIRVNLILSLGYNLLMVPLAVAGLVTPLIAAIAMSSSSLLVLLNSFRIRKGRAAQWM